MNETRRKPTTGRQPPSLFDKWHGVFYMPSCIDEAGHTKAFDYPVAGHWGESRGGSRNSLKGGGGGSGPEFFEGGGGGLGSRSVGIFIYWQAKKRKTNLWRGGGGGGGGKPPNPPPPLDPLLESQRTKRSLVGFEPTSAHTYESEIQRSTNVTYVWCMGPKGESEGAHPKRNLLLWSADFVQFDSFFKTHFNRLIILNIVTT